MRKRPVRKQQGGGIQGRPRCRPLQRLDAESLHEAALRYVARFAASAQMVRCALQRRIDRAAAAGLIDAAAGEALVAAALDRLRRSGLIDDDAFARLKVERHLRQGRSQRHIRDHLTARGVDKTAIDAALSGLGANFELMAAVRLAKKRRFGPWRSGEADLVRRDKELAALGRAGFSWEVAVQVIDGAIEALETG